MEEAHKDTRGGEPVDRGGPTTDRGGPPIDRGWAWIVVLGTFLIYLIHPSYFYFTSVLFLDFMDVFDTSATTVTLILAMTNVSYCVSTLVLVNLVMPVMSVRRLTTISCIVYSVANWAVVVSPTLPVFFVVCVVKYIAQGGVLVPPLTLVGHYFERRRALATSLSLLGISVASIMVPPVTRYIRNEYGFRGCFLLLSAYEINFHQMQAIIAAMLLRPLSCYSKKQETTKAQQCAIRDQAVVEIQDDDPRVMLLESTSPKNLPLNKLEVLLPPEQNTNEVNFSHHKKHDKRIVSDNFESNGLVSEYSTSDVTRFSSGVEKNNDVMCIANGRSLDHQMPLNGVTSYKHTVNSPMNDQKLRRHEDTDMNIQETKRLTSSSSMESLGEDFVDLKLTEIDRSIICQSTVDPSVRHLETRKYSRNDAHLLGITDSSQKTTDQTVPYHDIDDFHVGTSEPNGETNFKTKWFGNDQAELASLIISIEDAQIEGSKFTTNESCLSRSLKAIRSALDFSLLRNYLAMLYLFTFGLHHSSVFLATYVPSYAVKVGVSQPSAAILLTIVGTCDGVSRVAYGFFADLRLVRPSRVLAGSYMFLGLVCQFTSQFTNFESLAFLAVSYGCCGLSHLSLNAPLIVDLLGVENLGKVFALGALASSVFISVQFPVHGLLIEATDSFVASFHWIGATFMLSSLCLLSEPVVRRLEGKRRK